MMHKVVSRDDNIFGPAHRDRMPILSSENSNGDANDLENYNGRHHSAQFSTINSRHIGEIVLIVRHHHRPDAQRMRSDQPIKPRPLERQLA